MKAPCAGLIALLLATTSAAWGAPRRRHFEPDDLELEQPGILDFDLQVGPARGSAPSGTHVLLPDFEIALGLTHSVEFDVSGTFTLERQDGKRHLTGDALWIATKLGLFDDEDDYGNAWAFGLELGPRLPTLDAAGIGYGALGLLGFTHHKITLVLNAGTLIDPGATLSEEHPSSLVFGLDVNVVLDQRSQWSLQGELGAAHYLSSDPDELAFALGVTYSVNQRLDVSLTALSGLLRDTDHAGLLLGVSPQVGLW